MSNRHINTDNLEGFVMKNRMGWVMDGKPPAPSEAELAQSRAGHIDVDIQDIKRRAGISEETDPREVAIGEAIATLSDIFVEIQQENATPKHIQARLGDVIQILRRGIQGGQVDAGY